MTTISAPPRVPDAPPPAAARAPPAAPPPPPPAPPRPPPPLFSPAAPRRLPRRRLPLRPHRRPASPEPRRPADHRLRLRAAALHQQHRDDGLHVDADGDPRRLLRRLARHAPLGRRLPGPGDGR